MNTRRLVMWCPKCKYEYGKESTVCPDCHSALVEQLSEECVIDIVDPVRIKFISNQVDAELILNLFRDNAIQCFSQSRETGAYMNIYMGYSVYGQDIFVDKNDCVKALELLEFLDTVPEPIDEQDNEMEYHVPFYRNPQKVVRTTLIVLASIYILILLLGYLQ